jgi:threonine/homoserine/homoserine lactone efflux protein
MDPVALGLFLVSAVALLGSPGPGIASLLAVGRTAGLARGLHYYTGLQLGLAAAAGVSAAGLFSLLQAFPALLRIMTIAATLYLVWLAYQIATAPVGMAGSDRPAASSPMAGLLLGVTNPKAYVAFASLLASQAILRGHPGSDLLVKWCLCVGVMIVVDLAWLLAGVALRQARLPARSERVLNRCLGAMILTAAVLALL